jgi:hypothetical protein
LLHRSCKFIGTIEARCLYLREKKTCEASYEGSTIANRSELKGTRERLSQHLWKVFLEGEHDPHRLTVHGLTYLQSLDLERDS